MKVQPGQKKGLAYPFHWSRKAVTDAESMVRMAENSWLRWLRRHGRRRRVPPARARLVDGDPVTGSYVQVLVVLPDIDRDQHVIAFQKVTIGGVVKVDFQHLTIAAPVTAEIEEHALLFFRCLGQRSGNIRLGLPRRQDK